MQVGRIVYASAGSPHAAREPRARSRAPWVPRGLMRRHERAVYLIAGTGLTSAFGDTIHAHWSSLPTITPLVIGIGLVAIVGNTAAITRLVRITRALDRAYPRNAVSPA